MAIRIQLFGAFSELTDTSWVDLEESAGSVRDVKKRLKQWTAQHRPDFLNVDLVEDSVLANDHEILGDDRVIGEGEILALLPPVCGG